MRTGKFISTLAAAMLCASCVYDFNVDIQGADEQVLVMEGDIIAGDVTKLACSYMTPVGRPHQEGPNFKAEIQSSDGKIFSAPQSRGPVEIDTRTASPDLEYKLSVTNLDNMRVYETEWLPVHRAPVIDDLSSRENFEKERLDIGITAHGDNEQYFKWRFEETWEYHSTYYGYLKYNTPTGLHRNGEVVEYGTETNKFYCWKHEESKDVRLFRTDNLSESTFVDLEFHSVSRYDKRLSILYHMKVYIESISRDAYDYWDAIGSYSNNPGDLFSPIPSEIPGNIHCVSDPSAKAIGFISASTESCREQYFEESQFCLATYEQPEEEPKAYPELSWPAEFKRGLIPFAYVSEDDHSLGSLWTEARCVDCTLNGGSKEKPSGWPTEHE